MPPTVTISYKAEGFPEHEDANHEMTVVYTLKSVEPCKDGTFDHVFTVQGGHTPARNTLPNDPTGLFFPLKCIVEEQDLAAAAIQLFESLMRISEALKSGDPSDREDFVFPASMFKPKGQ